MAGQFTSFKKAGTLSSSFVSASSSSTSSPRPAKVGTPVVIESVAERLAKEAQREVDEYQRSLLEGDKQETGGGTEENPAGVTSPSKIVFKSWWISMLKVSGSIFQWNSTLLKKT